MKAKYLFIALIALSAWLLEQVPVGFVEADNSAAASFTGMVKFEGTAPKPTRIDMSFDPNCAKAHPVAAANEEVAVGTNGGLANVVVYVADGLGDRTFQPPTQPVVLEQKGCTYRPHVIALQANQKFDIVNADATTHNIHPIPVNNREWNKIQPPGLPIEETFAREEIAIPVKCNVHPWMRGYIAVFKHPYFAVTDNNGGFELKDLPSGSYTIKAWHEKLGAQTQKLVVTAGQGGKLDFVFKP